MDGAGGGAIDLIGVGWSCVWDWGWVAARGVGGGEGGGWLERGLLERGGGESHGPIGGEREDVGSCLQGRGRGIGPQGLRGMVRCG